MFNQKDLYAALQSGTNPEAIAQQFADALNGAIAQQNKEKAEAEAAKKVEAERAKARLAAVQNIIDAVTEFVKEFYPDMYDPAIIGEANAEELDKAIQQAYKETVAMMGPLKELMRMKQQVDAQNAKPVAKPVLKTVATATPQDADAALKAFLTRNGF
jgi:hypothetical protein